MTITREDLELAALAAGHTILYWSNPVGPVLAEHPGEVGEYLWRPHTDDGDAARLAGRLRLRVEFDNDAGPGYSVAEQYIDDIRECGFKVMHDGSEPDKMRAWREAVVKCAAAVGRRMRGAK